MDCLSLLRLETNIPKISTQIMTDDSLQTIYEGLTSSPAQVLYQSKTSTQQDGIQRLGPKPHG